MADDHDLLMCLLIFLGSRLGDVINDWRVDCLNLEALAATVGPDIVSILKIPYTYCWSPALVPKPIDWADNFGT
jgi:hypothetical protein